MVRIAALALLFVQTAGVFAQDATIRVDRSDDGFLFSRTFYQGDRLIGTIGRGEIKDVVFQPDPNGRVILTERIYAVGIVERNFPIFMDNYNPGAFLELKYNDKQERTWKVTNYGVDVRNLKVNLEPQMQEKEISSEIVETPPGVKRTVKRSRTVEHSLSITDTTAGEIEKKVNFGVVSAAIRGRIESSLNAAYKQSETVEQFAEIDGSVLPRARVVWVERTMVGKAAVTINSVPTEMPFAFR